jgi:hypothetical protein
MTLFDEMIQFEQKSYETLHGFVYWDIAFVVGRVIESNEQTTGARKLVAVSPVLCLLTEAFVA